MSSMWASISQSLRWSKVSGSPASRTSAQHSVCTEKVPALRMEFSPLSVESSRLGRLMLSPAIGSPQARQSRIGRVYPFDVSPACVSVNVDELTHGLVDGRGSEFGVPAHGGGSVWELDAGSDDTDARNAGFVFFPDQEEPTGWCLHPQFLPRLGVGQAQ